ncbi:unnamed protein product, partial [Prorocentrum cordatum]
MGVANRGGAAALPGAGRCPPLAALGLGPRGAPWRQAAVHAAAGPVRRQRRRQRAPGEPRAAGLRR